MFNFISFGSLISTVFMIVAVYFIFSIKDRSKASTFLGIMFIYEIFHNAGILIGFVFYDPLAAYHRWMSAISAMLTISQPTQFFFHFPETKKPRLALFFMILQYLIIVVVGGLFINQTLTLDKIFMTDGQLWNVVPSSMDKLYALILLVFLLTFSFVAVWRIITTPGKRNDIVMFLITFLAVSLLPTITSQMVKRGAISVEVFYNIWNSCCIIGWFLVIILYINSTKDRTSFMDKIVGVSLVTFFVIMLFIGYGTLGDKDRDYNSIHQQRAHSIIFDNNYRPDDFEYIKEIENRKNFPVREIKQDKKLIKHYMVFYHYDSDKDKTYEVGFNYITYRKYIHNATMRLIYIFFIGFIVILFGFRLFFLRALQIPLRALIRALKQVGKGNLDIQIPILVEDEIGFLTHRFNSMVNTIKLDKEKIEDYAHNLEKKVDKRTEELQVANEELEAINNQLIETRDALWGEMQLAKKIQTVLLPLKPRIVGYELSAYMAPADEVGGDYYDIVNVANRDWIVIGDVSGHGVPAGLVMMMVQTAINVTLNQKPDIKPTDLLININKTIVNNIRQLGEDKYMTIVVIAAYENGKFYFSGLHQDIMIYRAKSKSIDLVETNGMWIGLLDDIRNMLDDDTFYLDIDDVLLLYTDGITEAWIRDSIENYRTPLKDMFGQERLADIFQSLGNVSPENIKKGILQELENYTTNDDITLVVMKRIK